MAVTREELAEYCGLSALPTGPKLIEFERFLAAAKRHVAAATGRVDGMVTIQVASDGGRTLALPAVFSVSVLSVTAPSGTRVTPTMANPATGVVELACGERGLWAVQVLGGQLPADLELAVLEIGRHLYNSQRLSLRTDAAEGVSVPAFTIPNRARDLMEPYLMPAIG